MTRSRQTYKPSIRRDMSSNALLAEESPLVEKPDLVMSPTHRTTLGAFGALPIGLPRAGGGRTRTIAFKRWMMDDEFELGAIAARSEAMAMPRYYMEILSHFLVQLGDIDMKALEPTQRLLHLMGLYAADFLAAWTLLRIHAMGPKLPLKLQCPHCGPGSEPFGWDVHLPTIPLIVAEDHHPLRREIALQDGFEVRGQIVHSVIIAPYRWNAYEVLGKDRGNLNALRASIVRSAIVGLPDLDREVALTEGEMRKGLTKADFEIIFAEAQKDHVGLDFKMNVDCPACTRQFSHSVPWEYGSFFLSPGSSP